MGDVVPFPNRRGPRRRAPHQQRRRVEWRAYNPNTGGYANVSDEAQAIATAAELNADEVEDGQPAVWRAERRTVGDWNTL